MVTGSNPVGVAISPFSSALFLVIGAIPDRPHGLIDHAAQQQAALPRQMVVVRIKRHAMHHGRAMAAAAKKAVRIDDARRETPPHLVEGAEHAALPPEVIRQRQVQRSEEHTSELQSLMRISYAVFC